MRKRFTQATTATPLPREHRRRRHDLGRRDAAMLNPGQVISRPGALRMYTAGSACLSFDGDKPGAIEKGKLADLVVSSDNPLTVSDDQFRRISSVLALQAGRAVHEAAGFHASS